MLAELSYIIIHTTWFVYDVYMVVYEIYPKPKMVDALEGNCSFRYLGLGGGGGCTYVYCE